MHQALFRLGLGGLAVSTLVHVLALFGIQSPFGGGTWLLHIALFLPFIPVLIGNKDRRQELYPWRLFRTCPRWVSALYITTFVNALVNFVRSVTDTPKTLGSSGAAPPEVLRGFSGGWMFFYSLIVAYSYVLRNSPEPDADP